MSMTPEGKVKAAVVKMLKEKGVYYFFPATGGYGRSGTPDIVGCIYGKFFAIECKRPGGKPTALQTMEMNLIKHQGGFVCVYDGTEPVQDLWARLDALYHSHKE